MANSEALKQWFDRVDSAHIGNITAIQLQNALTVGNLDLPLSVVQQMIRMYDFDNNGTMNFEEFVALNKFLLKVLVYTPDGRCLLKYQAYESGLGVKTISRSPCGQFLAVGSYDQTLRLEKTGYLVLKG